MRRVLGRMADGRIGTGTGAGGGYGVYTHTTISRVLLLGSNLAIAGFLYWHVSRKKPCARQCELKPKWKGRH